MTEDDESERAWATRIRAERKARGWSAAAMARELRDAADGRTQDELPQLALLVDYVRRWERGTVGITERYRMLYAAAFGVTEDSLFAVTTPQPSSGSPPLKLPAGAFNPDDEERLSQAISAPRRADAATVTAFEQLFDAVTEVPETLPTDLITTMAPVYDVIQGFRRDAPPGVRPGLLSVCSRTAQLVSWMHFESGDLAAAVAWSDRALNAALQAGDEELVAYTLARRSSYAGAEGDPAQGVDLAIAARQRTTLPPQVEHMVLRHEAQGLAQLGDASACQGRLSESVDTLTRSDLSGEPAYASGFSMNYLNVQIAGCYIEIGRRREAIEMYERELPILTPGYVRAFNVSRLARAYQAVGDAARASKTAKEALALAQATGAVRALRELDRGIADGARWWD